MPRLFATLVGRLDSAYAAQPYFTRLKARLLVVVCGLLFVLIAVNFAKLAWLQPPHVALRAIGNLMILASALAGLHWTKRGRIELAGNVLALGLIVPVHALLFVSSDYQEPLSFFGQLLLYDVVFLLLTLVFASRAVAFSVLGVVVGSIALFHQLAFAGDGPIPGSLAFAASTLLRDGLLGVVVMFFLGLTVVQMIEAANRRSEQALRETRATNENLGALVAERTQALGEMTREAQASSRAKGEFLANMSHEIRTPLNGIIASADLLRRRGDLPPSAAEHVRIIAESGDLLLRLIGDILDFSKIDAGQLEIDRHPFELAALVRDVTGLVANAAGAGGVQLALHVDPALPTHVSGDSYRLRQVLMNLVANAIKFTPAGGRVWVDVKSPAAEKDPVAVRFEVRDTGIGMDAATVARIFERFTQADSSTTRRFGGSGLGLAISSHLVRLMGGKLEVESAPGRGSVFFFTLTLSRATPPAGAASAARIEGNLGLHVFVAEDNAVNRSILAAQLSQLGCHHTMAHDGEEVLARIAREPAPDVILMDCHMPKLDGWETTRRLRGWATDADEVRRRAAALPIVALTAAALPEERQRCIDAGMTAFLAKPVRLVDLLEALQRFTPAARRG